MTNKKEFESFMGTVRQELDVAVLRLCAKRIVGFDICVAQGHNDLAFRLLDTLEAHQAVAERQAENQRGWTFCSARLHIRFIERKLPRGKVTEMSQKYGTSVDVPARVRWPSSLPSAVVMLPSPTPSRYCALLCPLVLY